MASFRLAISLVLYTAKITSKHLFLHQQRKRNKLISPDNMVRTARHPVGARSHRLIPTLLLLLLLVCVPDFLLMVLLPKLEWNWIQQNILNVGTLAILFHFNFKWLLPSERIMSTGHLTLHFVTQRPNLRVWIESRTFVSKSALKQVSALDWPWRMAACGWLLHIDPCVTWEGNFTVSPARVSFLHCTVNSDSQQE